MDVQDTIQQCAGGASNVGREKSHKDAIPKLPESAWNEFPLKADSIRLHQVGSNNDTRVYSNRKVD